MTKQTIGVCTLAALLVAAGCGGGGSDRRTAGASTVAPVTSGNLPGNTGTTVGPPIVAPVTTAGVNQSANPNVVVASLLLNTVTVMDVNSGTQVASIPVGKGPAAVATNGTYAYTANSIGQTISVVDLLTNTVTAEINATDAGVSNLPLIGTTVDKVLKPLVRPTGIAVKPDGTKAFSANLVNVTSYDLVGLKASKSIFGLNLSFTSGSGSGLSGLLSAVTTGLQNFLAQPLAAIGQARVACTNKTAFVTNMVTSNVTVISASDDRVITYTPVGKLPIGVACAASKAYVACAVANEIYVLDEATGAVQNHFAAGQVPVDVTASPAGDFIYVANFLGGDITVIDTASDLPVNVLPAGLNIGSIFSQLGLPIPATSGGGIGGFISNFLGGFLGGPGSSSTAPGIGTLLGGGGSPLSLNSVLSGLLSGFLGAAGISQQTLNNLNMPGIGIVGVSVTADGTRVCGANLIFGLSITDIQTKALSSPGFLSGNSLGVSGVAAGR